jgi:hypothetical protein
MNNSVRLVDPIPWGLTSQAGQRGKPRLRRSFALPAPGPFPPSRLHSPPVGRRAPYFCDLHGRTKAFKMAPHSKPRPAGAARLALH